jgi:hypothetical protein
MPADGGAAMTLQSVGGGLALGSLIWVLIQLWTRRAG